MAGKKLYNIDTRSNKLEHLFTATLSSLQVRVEAYPERCASGNLQFPLNYYNRLERVAEEML